MEPFLKFGRRLGVGHGQLIDPVQFEAGVPGAVGQREVQLIHAKAMSDSQSELSEDRFAGLNNPLWMLREDTFPSNLSLFTDNCTDPLKFFDHSLVQVDDVVERIGNFPGDSRLIDRHSRREIALLDEIDIGPLHRPRQAD